MLDEKCQELQPESRKPWDRLKQKLQAIFLFSAEVIEEVIELNGEEERAFIAEVKQDAERLRQEAAAKQDTHQANEAA